LQWAVCSYETEAFSRTHQIENQHTQNKGFLAEAGHYHHPQYTKRRLATGAWSTHKKQKISMECQAKTSQLTEHSWRSKMQEKIR